MAVEVVEKKKRGLSCAECGASVTAGAECPECGSKEVKKSLVIVRKSVADTDEEIDALDDDTVDEDEDLDDDEADDDDDDDLDDEDDDDDDDDDDEDDDDEDEDEEDDEDDDDDDEDDDDDDTDASAVKKNLPLIRVEALNIGTALAEDISKVFAGDCTRAEYERVMNEMNNVMDAAADNWFAGGTVSKSISKNVNAISKRVSTITKSKGKTVGKKSTITKRADLPEDVRKSLEQADRIVEERETEKWLGIAKKYTDSGYPGSPETLAKSLRVLSETDETAYKNLVTTLDAGGEIIGKSALFETQGGSGGGAPEEVRKAAERRTAAQELVSKGDFKSIEAAEVSLMGGDHYKPTNA